MKKQTNADARGTGDPNHPEDKFKGNILVVDDTPANLRLLANMLTGQGYKVRSVINGPMALTATRAAHPDLILLDINMPGMNGYEVCETLKEDEETREIPIIFISALDEIQDKVKAFTVGGVDYITKPFQFEEVLARVETHLALRNMRRQLQAANVKLEKQVQELDAFAHTVAHDLKNPLGGVIGYAEFLIDEFSAGYTASAMPVDEFSDMLQGIMRSGCKMNRIIDELLLLAQLREGDMEVRPLDMAAVVSEVQQRLAYMIERYQAEIVLPETWPAALGYAPWVEEVWANYISNALKYGGEPPYVELGVTSLLDGRLRFWVRDNGKGLSPDAQAKLFAPFTRLHQVRAEGQGLGLSIVQRIVERLGGDVGVESEKGQGSTFFFTLQAEAAMSSPA
jgi:signal transduction histidine kinase